MSNAIAVPNVDLSINAPEDLLGAGITEAPQTTIAAASKGWTYTVSALITIVLPLLGLIYGGWLAWQIGIGWLDLSLLLVLYFFTVLGLELGYHRYLTHRSFTTTRWMRGALTLLGSASGHGPPVWWVAIHRRHHGHSDHQGDPHSPNLHESGVAGNVEGLWHSHIGWMFDPQCTAAHARHYAPDLMKDPLIQRIDALYPLWIALGLLLPAAIGGAVTGTWFGAWTAFIWGGLVRMFFCQHALWWGIVTLCHRWGSRPFESNDDSTNSPLVALLFLGDGWHNNHHAFPTSAMVGLRWWEFDITWWVIGALRACGLVWDIKRPTPAQITAKQRVPAPAT